MWPLYITCLSLLHLLPPTLSASLPPSLLPTLNNASQPPINLSTPIILPYIFEVPHTSMVLNLGFGLFHRDPLDHFELRRLILSAQRENAYNIWRDGPSHPVPGGADNDQRWSYIMASGNGPLEVHFGHWGHMPIGDVSPYTWAHVAEVLEGLRLYLVEGKRAWVTSFNFTRYKEKGGMVYDALGSGWVGKAEGSVADA